MTGVDASAEKKCYQCKWPVTAAICKRCGWDGERGRRTCLDCSGWVLAKPVIPAGPLVGGLTVFAAITAGLLGGLLGSLSFGFALGAVGSLIAFATLEARCVDCRKEPAATALSKDELDDIKGQRTLHLMGAGGFGAASLISFIVWIVVLVTGGRVSVEEEPVGPKPDIAAIEKKGAAAIPELVKALGDARVTIAAADALKKLGPKAAKPIAEALKSPSPRHRLYAAQALARLGPDAADASEALVAALHDGSIQLDAMNALAAIGTAAVEPLKLALSDSDEEVRRSAAEAFREMGVAAKPARTQLIRATKDRSVRVRASAAGALRNLGVEAVAALVECLKDPEADVVYAAAGSLQLMGAVAKPAIPALEPLTKHSDERVRRIADSAIRTLKR